MVFQVKRAFLSTSLYHPQGLPVEETTHGNRHYCIQVDSVMPVSRGVRLIFPDKAEYSTTEENQ